MALRPLRLRPGCASTPAFGRNVQIAVIGTPALGSGEPDRSPARPGIGADRPAADQAGPVHVPDRGLAAGVLKKNVGTAAVGSDGVPTRPGIRADRAAADQAVPVHFPDRDCLGDAANCRAQRSSLAGGYAAVCDCRHDRRGCGDQVDAVPILGSAISTGLSRLGATSRSRTILIAVRSPAFASSTAFCEMVTASASMMAKAAKVDLLSEPLGVPFGFGQTPLANVPSLFRRVFSGCCAASGCDTVTLPIMPEPMKPLAAN
jgi:hypothetical protein